MPRVTLERLIERVLAAPLVVWVLLGLAFTYLLYFIGPLFLSGGPMVVQSYIPAGKSIGVDLHSNVRDAAAFFETGQSPYIDNNQYAYPPLTELLFAPLNLAGWPEAYTLITLVNVGCVLLVGLLIPLSLSRPRPLSALLLLALLAGLFCYGFQFELERGQNNLIAVTLAFLAIWVYHAHPRGRLVAYGLFCLAVQLKVYPAIFILLLVHDWRAWAANLKRFVALGLVNFAALFVFGPRLALEFFTALAEHAANPYVWPGNHSLWSFTFWIAHNFFNEDWPTPYSRPLQLAGLALVLGCLALLWLLAYRRRQPALNPLLLLGCTIGALVIPAASHDYTLSFLVAPVALLFAQPDTWAVAPSRGRQAGVLALVVVFAAAYGTTLVSFVNKPLALYNNCPALLIMLVAATAIAVLAPPASSTAAPATNGPPATALP